MSCIYASGCWVVGLSASHTDSSGWATCAHRLSSSSTGPALANAHVVGRAVAVATVGAVRTRARRMLQVSRALARATDRALQGFCGRIVLVNTVAIHATLLLDVVVGWILLVWSRGRVCRRLVWLAWVSRRIDTRVHIVRTVWKRCRHCVNVTVHVGTLRAGRLVLVASVAWATRAHAAVVHIRRKLTIVVDGLRRLEIVLGRMVRSLGVEGRCPFL